MPLRHMLPPPQLMLLPPPAAALDSFTDVTLIIDDAATLIRFSRQPRPLLPWQSGVAR